MRSWYKSSLVLATTLGLVVGCHRAPRDVFGERLRAAVQASVPETAYVTREPTVEQVGGGKRARWTVQAPISWEDYSRAVLAKATAFGTPKSQDGALHFRQVVSGDAYSLELHSPDQAKPIAVEAAFTASAD